LLEFINLLTDISLYKSVVINLGPKSREILSLMCGYDLSNENFPPNSAAIIKIKDKSGEKHRVRALRVSFVGELGYELHIPKESCVQVYNILMRVGASMGLKNAGYRSMYSLSSEKGLLVM
jgi:sarcosine dehydrogenase